MARPFNPYHKWLGIPPEDQPPHYYRLLGIPLFEEDVQVIEAAADRQMAFLRKLQVSEHAEQARSLLNEVARARICLLKASSKSAYDLQLRQQLGLNEASRDASDGGAFEDGASELHGQAWRRLAALPVWQQPFLLAFAVILILGIGGGIYVLGRKPAAQPAGPDVKSASTAIEAGDVNADSPGVQTDSASASSNRSTSRQASSDQSRPLATGGNATGRNANGTNKRSQKNLIDGIDPVRDAVQGTWTMERGILNSGDQLGDRIRIPATVPPAYVLTIVAKRLSETGFGLAAILPIGKGQGLACVDCWDQTTSGLEYIRKRAGNGNETTVRKQFLKQGLNTLVYRVQPDGIRVEANQQLVFEWKGESSDVETLTQFAMPKTQDLGLLVVGTSWQFHSVTLEPTAVQSDTTELAATEEMAHGGAPAGIKTDAVEMPTASVPPMVEGVQAPASATKKQSVPDAAVQESARKTLKELFKAEYAQSKKQDGKIALARVLFTKGQEVDSDPPACFAMLSEATELAAAGGQLGLAWDAIEALGSRFEIDRLPLFERTAKTSAPFAKSFEEVRELTRMYLDLANEAIRLNEFETATRVIQVASQAVKKPVYASLRDQLVVANRRITAMREAYEEVEWARETLRTKATDPIASLAWGRFLCYSKNEWAEGVLLIAKGVDPVLSPLAQRELAMNEQSPPPTEQERSKLADDWWEIAETEKEPGKTSIRDHAAEIYWSAASEAQGLAKDALLQKADRVFGSTKFLDSKGSLAGITIAPVEFNPGQFFTIEFWISTTAENGALVSKRHNLEGESSLIVVMEGGIPAIASSSDSDLQSRVGKTKVNDGKWHHIAAVKVGQQLVLFVDGKKEVEITGLKTFTSLSQWKAGASMGIGSVAVRICRLRLSSTARYHVPFVPEKQYPKDSSTLYPK